MSMLSKSSSIVMIFLLGYGMTNRVVFADGVCNKIYNPWYLSEYVERRFSGPQHDTPLGLLGSMTTEVKKPTVFYCPDDALGVASYYTAYNNALGDRVEHAGPSAYIVYALPNVPGIGVSVDMADPNQPWVALGDSNQTLLANYYGDSVGFKSRIQFHIIGNLYPGEYLSPPIKVGKIWGEKVKNPNIKSGDIELWLPQVKIVVNVDSCELNVPAQVNLGSDIRNSTPFVVRVDQCSGPVDVFTRFSDAAETAVKKDSLINTGSAKGYVLKIETKDGQPIDIIPVGTNRAVGEIPMGKANKDLSLSKEFQARVVKDGIEQQDGSLEFGAIVGVSYR